MTLTNEQLEANIQAHYGATHTISKVAGTEVELRFLKKGQSVCWGDGKTFYYLLTERASLLNSAVNGKEGGA